MIDLKRLRQDPDGSRASLLRRDLGLAPEIGRTGIVGAGREGAVELAATVGSNDPGAIGGGGVGGTAGRREPL